MSNQTTEIMKFSAFKKQYDYLTDVNDHTGAAKLLVDRYGTEDDKEQIDWIAARHERYGRLNCGDQEIRDNICKKYLHFVKYQASLEALTE